MTGLKWGALAALALLSACAPQKAEMAKAELSQAELVKRGEYLVLGVAGSNDCHTPMTPKGPDMAFTLQGAELTFGPKIEMPFAHYAPPLAGGPAGFDKEQFVSFLQTGVRPNGSSPL